MALCSMDCPVTKIFHIFSLRNIYHALSGNFTHVLFSVTNVLVSGLLLECPSCPSRVRQASE